ncbi:hypothetical protein KM043_004760 [Ampulex compressa]|nr:hypothetical protein KM043_004760 [Ampulex compressa]
MGGVAHSFPYPCGHEAGADRATSWIESAPIEQKQGCRSGSAPSRKGERVGEPRFDREICESDEGKLDYLKSLKGVGNAAGAISRLKRNVRIGERGRKAEITKGRGHIGVLDKNIRDNLSPGSWPSRSPFPGKSWGVDLARPGHLSEDDRCPWTRSRMSSQRLYGVLESVDEGGPPLRSYPTPPGSISALWAETSGRRRKLVSELLLPGVTLVR